MRKRQYTWIACDIAGVTLLGSVIAGVLLIVEGSGVTDAVLTDVDVGKGEEASGDCGATCVTIHGCGVAGVREVCCIGCSLSMRAWK